jgi:DNA-binding transcriptional regulator YiaG
MKQCIICDREIPSGIGPRCPRCRQYLHRTGVERPVNLLCARDRATMTGATFRQWRQSWGWSLRQIAEAQHYTYQAVISWEKGRCAVPEAIAAWVRAIGNPPNTRHYRGTVAGLIQYMREHEMRPVELAAFLGIDETTVCRWLASRTPLPPPMRTWLRAGAPADWEQWGPPGTLSCYRASGRKTGYLAQTRPYIGLQRPGPPRLIYRLLQEHIG